jgi:hypothetical protein
MKTEKLKFIQDGFVSGKLEFEKGKVYDVPVETGSVARWIKRGMAIVFEQGEEAEVIIPVLEVPSEDVLEAPVEQIELEQEVQEEQEIAKKQPKTQNKKGNLGKGL